MAVWALPEAVRPVETTFLLMSLHPSTAMQRDSDSSEATPVEVRITQEGGFYEQYTSPANPSPLPMRGRPFRGTTAASGT